MIRRPPRSTLSSSSAASDVYKRQIFNWIATMWGGSVQLKTAMLFALALVVNFTIGGLSGVGFSLVPVDWRLTDTYFVVAHIHYVLIGGSLTGGFAAAYYWFPNI